MRIGALLFVFLEALYLTNVQAANPIILISIDGLRPDAIAKADAETLIGLINDGTSFINARTVRPSITLPAHTSMITGLDPEQHGITWDFYLPQYGPVRFKTALEIAKENGLHTALIVSKDKLIHLNRPDSVDHFETTEKEGQAVAKAFADYVSENGLPDLTMLHLPDPDTMGHKLLWMSHFYLNGVRDADRAVKSILETARSHLDAIEPTIIITADHGGHGFGHLADIHQNNYIPMIFNGENIPTGLIKEDYVQVYDVAATILSMLNLPIPHSWIGRPISLTPTNEVLRTHHEKPCERAAELF